MKQLILIGVMACAATATLRGATLNCADLTSLTFQGLENAGSCIIGDKLYSNFSLLASAQGGATPLTASGINYSVIDNGAIANGFNFQFILNAFAGQSNDVLLGYDVGILFGDSLITSAHLAITGGQAIGAGSAATVSETVCPGHSIAGCPAALPLSAYVLGTGGAKLTDAVTFPGVTLLGVSKDINVQGGGENSFATISGVTQVVDQTSVPEPMTLSLMGAGLLGIGLLGRRFRKK